jgi:hypothetical protein
MSCCILKVICLIDSEREIIFSPNLHYKRGALDTAVHSLFKFCVSSNYSLEVSTCEVRTVQFKKV